MDRHQPQIYSPQGAPWSALSILLCRQMDRPVQKAPVSTKRKAAEHLQCISKLWIRYIYVFYII